MAGRILSPGMGGHSDAGVITLVLCLFLDLPGLNPRCVELAVRELQQVFVVAGGIAAS